MKRQVIFLIILLFVVIVGGAMLLIGVLSGDDTSVDKNGVNSAPHASHDDRSSRPASSALRL